MENILLVKIQTNVNQRKHIHNNLLSNVSHTIKVDNFGHQNWSDCFICLRTYFSLPGVTGSYIFGYLIAKFRPVGS